MKTSLVRLLFAGVVLLSSSAHAGVPAPPACVAGTMEFEAGSSIDLGWTGFGHDGELVAGTRATFGVLSRCSDDDSACASNEDCGDATCVPTCDCATDTSCDILGPVGGKHCLTTLTDCSSDDDCAPEAACVSHLGPPQPLTVAGVPLCAVQRFTGPLSGTFDSASGDLTFRADLHWRLFLGIDAEFPCPRCGAPGESPEVGDVFTCEGGQTPGASCTVDGVTETFGGVSFDCAPALQSGISGAGISVPLREMTTGTTAKTAELPCKFFGFHDNPLVPGTHPKCTDRRGAEDPECSSNADCLRCDGDPSIACTTNGDCAENGPCAEAPDQPVTCGFWCHCGFCDGNGSLPCFEDGDCPASQECVMGTGSGTSPGAPQQRPNDCANDGFLCGTEVSEQCASTTFGTCSGAPWIPCIGDEPCDEAEAGTCVEQIQSCFESRIERTGDASPVGQYCAFENKECTSNVDCTGDSDFCVSDSAHASLAGLACVPSSASSAVNASIGIAGPAALEWNTRVKLCHCGEEPEPGCEDSCGPLPGCGTAFVCGDGQLDTDCGEDCDDANLLDGDGCSSSCKDQTLCGDANDDGEILTGDALLILQKAVGTNVQCSLTICDVDASGEIRTNDSLRTLRKAVELPVELECDYGT